MSGPATQKKMVNPVNPGWNNETEAEKETKESLSGKRTPSSLGVPTEEKESDDEESREPSEDEDVPREVPPDGLYGPKRRI